MSVFKKGVDVDVPMRDGSFFLGGQHLGELGASIVHELSFNLNKYCIYHCTNNEPKLRLVALVVASFAQPCFWALQKKPFIKAEAPQLKFVSATTRFCPFGWLSISLRCRIYERKLRMGVWESHLQMIKCSASSLTFGVYDLNKKPMPNNISKVSTDLHTLDNQIIQNFPSHPATPHHWFPPNACAAWCRRHCLRHHCWPQHPRLWCSARDRIGRPGYKPGN